MNVSAASTATAAGTSGVSSTQSRTQSGNIEKTSEKSFNDELKTTSDNENVEKVEYSAKKLQNTLYSLGITKFLKIKNHQKKIQIKKQTSFQKSFKILMILFRTRFIKAELILQIINITLRGSQY